MMCLNTIFMVTQKGALQKRFMKTLKFPSTASGCSLKAYLMRLAVIAISATCMNNPVFAQIDSAYVAGIKGYISEIDSLIRAEPDFIVQGIAEGPISSTITADRPGHIDTSNYSGGFSIYTTVNRKGDTLYRINYNDNLLMYRVENYYYRSNQLVCATLTLEDWGHGPKRVVYKKEEYYQNQNGSNHQTDEIITDILDDKYLWRVNLSLSDKGRAYLKQFLDKKSINF